ncbi:uncharacterized protein CLUP02_08358 [Colletotrichum lupini]|uniref:Secreted protein n=1 Tax=Colletotrichum lupini TaxID=145971 RepID=A0A9Q8WGJ6_9PEZI|nr:uncharacterized protein CLUP02_08358 [Colletotrichum lupini]KAK1717777.1 hypothetical protein BDP67DRAFT_507022 [Colletotrichum lupini]UQC82868.1 hypothetical protein CLUP02_08358 [Colletotrichum lupini]
MQKYQSRNVLGLAIFLVSCSACIGKRGRQEAASTRSQICATLTQSRRHARTQTLHRTIILTTLQHNCRSPTITCSKAKFFTRKT